MPADDIDDHSKTERSEAAPRPSLSFLVLFGLLFIAVTHFLGNMLPETALGWMMSSTAFLVVRLLRVLGIAAVSEGIRVVLPGFAMKVNLECTAVHYVGIYVLGVLLYPSHRLPYKLLGAAAGTVLIIAVNILRVGMVGIIGIYSAGLAGFVHTYLWQGVFAVFVFMLWISWVKGPSLPGMSAIRFVVIFLSVSATAVLILEILMGSYVKLLAHAAHFIVHTLSRTAATNITFSGEMIEYIAGTRLYAYSISTDVLDSAMFAALMAATSGLGRISRRAALTAGGYVVLLFIHLLFVIAVGYIAFKLTPTVLSDVFWILRSVSALIPIALWLLIWRWFRNAPKHNASEAATTCRPSDE